MPFIQHNVDTNVKLLSGKTTVTPLVWGQTDLKEFMKGRAPFDYVVGSDLVYERELAGLLLGVLRGVVAPSTEVLYASDRRGRDGFLLFMQEVSRDFEVSDLTDDELHPSFQYRQIRVVRMRRRAAGDSGSAASAGASGSSAESKSA